MLLKLFRYDLKSIKNYIAIRLDKITITELVLLYIACVFFLLQSLFQAFAFMSGKGQEALWLFFFSRQELGLLLLLSPAAFFVRMVLLNPRKEVLLSQPVPYSQISNILLLRVLLGWLLLLPIWSGILVCFYAHAKVPWSDLLVLGIYHHIVFLFPLVPVLLFYIARYGSRKINIAKWSNVLIFTAVLTAISLLGNSSQQMGRLAGLTLMALFALLLAGSLVHSGLTTWLQLGIKVSSGGIRLSKRPALFLRMYLLPVPAAIKPLVKKDYLYFTRKYKSYPVVLWGFILVISLGIWRAANASEGLQWFLSLCIAAGYVFSNLAFKLNESQCEAWDQLRSLPVKAGTWWLAKFCNGFLPVIWITLVGALVLWLRHQPNLLHFTGGLFIVLFISATLIHIANNFGLHAYPYSRYASLWYNLYLITAILFFTILLFPPLAIGFLLFGYLAITWVLKRMMRVEIIND